MTSSRRPPEHRPAGRRRRPWYRSAWIFAVLGVGLLVLWFVLRSVSDRQDAGGAGKNEPGGSGAPSRSDLFWAEPTDIIFWVAMVILAVVALARILRLIRRLLR